MTPSQVFFTILMSGEISAEATFWGNTLFQCPFGCEMKPTKNIIISLNHFKDFHSIEIHNPKQTIPFLQEYFDEIYRQLSNGDLDTKTLGLESNQNDFEIRTKLLEKSLENALSSQQATRSQNTVKNCLFCREKTDSLPALFSHFFTVHGLTIGQLDNLVYVEEFLELLAKKLSQFTCLFCEKVFPSNMILRKHMRKKKHFQINPKNQIYDRFYLKSYKINVENDVDEVVDDGDFEDWDDDVEQSETMCLFDDTLWNSPEECCAHMLKDHGFDLVNYNGAIMDFYKRVKLINYIRERSFKCICYLCSEQYNCFADLIEHFGKSSHGIRIPDEKSSCWKDPNYFFPYYESDPLLTLDFEE
jgi:hypothetical protein